MAITKIAVVPISCCINSLGNLPQIFYVMKRYLGSYHAWVFAAYAFYLLLGLAGLILGLAGRQHINFIALALVIAFGAQFKYRHILTNLILGVVCLLLSIFMLLQSINITAQISKTRTLVFADKMMVAIPIVSIFMAGILIFSFLKLNFKED